MATREQRAAATISRGFRRFTSRIVGRGMQRWGAYVPVTIEFSLADRRRLNPDAYNQTTYHQVIDSEKNEYTPNVDSIVSWFHRDSIRSTILQALQGGLRDIPQHHFKVVFTLEMVRAYHMDDREERVDNFYQDFLAQGPYSRRNLDSVLNDFIDKIPNYYAKWTDTNTSASVYSILNITGLRMELVGHDLVGAHYRDLPSWLKSKHAVVSVINIQTNKVKYPNMENMCFIWSILAAKYPVNENPHRVQHYIPHVDELRFDPDDIPMHVNLISKFERMNRLRIQVYGLKREFYDDNKDFLENEVDEDHSSRPMVKNFPFETLHMATGPEDAPLINLFFYQPNQDEPGHYSWIKNLSRFFGFDKHGSFRSAYICPKCCSYSFATKDGLRAHERICVELSSSGSCITMPDQDRTKPMKWAASMRAPVILVGDYECFMDEQRNHIPNSWDIGIISSIDIQLPLEELADLGVDVSPDKILLRYMGPDCASKMIRTLLLLEQPIIDARKDAIKRPKSRTFDTPIPDDACCTICGMDNSDPDRYQQWMDIKEDLDAVMEWVHHHDHYTGEYLGPAHFFCNRCVRQKPTGDIPIVFHNANYDIRCLFHGFKEGTKVYGEQIRFNAIAGGSMEGFKQFQMNRFRFVDSLAHLGMGLDDLIKLLRPDQKKYLNTLIPKDLPNYNRICELAMKKGIYPYESASWELLDKPWQEVTQDMFYTQTSRKTCSDGDYQDRSELLTLMGFQTFREEHLFYLNRDVLGLMDVIEAYREECYSNYKLDPMCFISAPGLAWATALRTIQRPLPLFQDQAKYEFYQSTIRGGMSIILGKEANANNPYIPGYDPEKPRKYIMQWDCNSLYAYIMMQPLPVTEPQWLTEDEIVIFQNNIHNLSRMKQEGYNATLEVDLHIPQHLHELFDFPPIAEHFEPTEDMLSPMVKYTHMMNRTKPAITKKLTLTFFDKRNYKANLDLLIYWQQLGVVVTAIYRGLWYQEAPFLHPFIKKNIELRTNAKKNKNKFGANFYKLLNNSLYGKTCQNAYNRNCIQFASNEKTFRRIRNSPRFQGIQVDIGEALSVCRMAPQKICLDSPVYLGATILDLAKLHMLKFHYECIRRVYGNRARILKHDTDSLTYEIETDDVYEDLVTNPIMNQFIERGNDGYKGQKSLNDHDLFDDSRLKVPGLFQDECADDTPSMIALFLGLRAKLFCYQIYDRERNAFYEKAKAKGVPKMFVPNVKEQSADISRKRKNIDSSEPVYAEDPTEYRLSVKKFRKALDEGENQFVNGITSIQSKQLCNRTTTIERKLAVSCTDDKVYTCWDRRTVYIYGDYRIERIRNEENILLDRIVRL